MKQMLANIVVSCHFDPN